MKSFSNWLNSKKLNEMAGMRLRDAHGISYTIDGFDGGYTAVREISGDESGETEKFVIDEVEFDGKMCHAVVSLTSVKEDVDGGHLRDQYVEDFDSISIYKEGTKVFDDMGSDKSREATNEELISVLKAIMSNKRTLNYLNRKVSTRD